MTSPNLVGRSRTRSLTSPKIFGDVILHLGEVCAMYACFSQNFLTSPNFHDISLLLPLCLFFSKGQSSWFHWHLPTFVATSSCFWLLPTYLGEVKWLFDFSQLYWEMSWKFILSALSVIEEKMTSPNFIWLLPIFSLTSPNFCMTSPN